MKPRRKAHSLSFHVSLLLMFYDIGDYRLKLFFSTPRIVRSDSPQIRTGLLKKGMILFYFDSPILKWRLFSHGGEPSYDARYTLRYAKHHSKGKKRDKVSLFNNFLFLLYFAAQKLSNLFLLPID